MTHFSSFKYGSALLEHPGTGNRYSEVRIGYFDPVTGEPCATKPKPLDKKAKPKTSAYKRDVQRRAAEAEAAEIMSNMKKRKEAAAKERERDRCRKRASKQTAPKQLAQKRRGSAGHPGRPVLVDGVLFSSVTAAAKHIGTSDAHLCRQLRSGATKVKGRNVRFAEVIE